MKKAMKAVFFTHAGENIGGGHLSRCFALSQALEKYGVKCSWVLNRGAASQANILGVSGAEFRDDPFGDAGDRLEDADMAVVDTYVPGADFYEAIARKTKLVVVDDLHDRGVERFAGVLINYGVGAGRGLYARSESEFLLGPRYALLRAEYWDMAPSEGDYVLFVPGAADVLGASAEIARLWPRGQKKLVVVLGALVPDARVEETISAAAGKKNVEVTRNPSDFPALAAGASFVICSASVTAYEVLAMRKRTAVFTAAANQEGFGEKLEMLGAAFNIGAWKNISQARLEEAMSFRPDEKILDGLVNPRGALECARKIVEVPGNF
jgi:spore coat polysaccharide biosynthesis predicted glycosyltransferase SpsG